MELGVPGGLGDLRGSRVWGLWVEWFGVSGLFWGLYHVPETTQLPPRINRNRQLAADA